LGSLIEKRLMGMMEAEVSDGVEHSYSIVVADHNKFGFSDENDTRILCGYLDASLRASGDATEKAIAVDKVRVMGKGLFDNCISLPDGRAWFGPPLDCTGIYKVAVWYL